MEDVPQGSCSNVGTVQLSKKEIYLQMKNHLNSEIDVIIENLEKCLSKKSGQNFDIRFEFSNLKNI